MKTVKSILCRNMAVRPRVDFCRRYACRYGDQFNLCALGDAEAVPDVWPLITGFRASLEELLECAEARPSPIHRPAPSTTRT